MWNLVVTEKEEEMKINPIVILLALIGIVFGALMFKGGR